MDKALRAELLEKLAELEHLQWEKWSKAVAEEVSPERAARWKNYWVPYDQLDEKTKKLDREWAEEVLKLLEPYVASKSKAVVFEVDSARYPELAKVLGAERSLKPPKKWFAKMEQEIRDANPAYSDERVRQTLGDIWYHQLSDDKKAEIREREGKEYGPATAGTEPSLAFKLATMITNRQLKGLDSLKPEKLLPSPQAFMDDVKTELLKLNAESYKANPDHLQFDMNSVNNIVKRAWGFK